MSSILSSLKQRPSDVQYFTPLSGSAIALTLNQFTPDVLTTTTSYVSGAAAGQFAPVTISAAQLQGDASGAPGIPIFRDLGITVVSSARTFRGVQLLAVDRNGSSGWTSTTATPGVWQASVEGVGGSPAVTNGAANGFKTYYFETGTSGLGIAQGLVRYG